MFVQLSLTPQTLKQVRSRLDDYCYNGDMFICNGDMLICNGDMFFCNGDMFFCNGVMLARYRRLRCGAIKD